MSAFPVADGPHDTQDDPHAEGAEGDRPLLAGGCRQRHGLPFGQIGLDPATGELVAGGIEAQARRVFTNLAAVAEAAGSSLAAAVRVTIYLVDFGHFAVVNGIMQEYFNEPYPARVTIAAAGLPRGAAIEVDCILVP